MEGLLLIDKPAGWTSFDVVNKIRRLSGAKKVGHAGTLDPFATGLLIVLLGGYTKRQAEFMKLHKVYEVTATLGQVSTTGDPEGELTAMSSDEPSTEVAMTTLQEFEGQIEQVPPAYSAIKVNGKRAYELARAGKEVSLEPRTVTVHISQVTFAYPVLEFTAEVSSGTYIRSLVEDIGTSLGTGAYTTQLRRTSIAGWGVDAAVGMDGLTAEAIKKNLVQAT